MEYSLQEFHIRAIKRELARRAKVNPRYSLRAFARSLHIDAGALSKTLAAKRPLSAKDAKKILANLTLTIPEQRKFADSVARQFSNSKLQKIGNWDNKTTSAYD